MRILYLGDIVGEKTIEVLRQNLDTIKAENKINLVLVASAFVIAYGIFFIDNDYLNSLFIDILHILFHTELNKCHFIYVA